uniref:Uncharacterized protein n=2 Tax=Arion vulgaris TaxID=1028688 RepID=A0A0B6ZS72_9EUPU
MNVNSNKKQMVIVWNEKIRTMWTTAQIQSQRQNKPRNLTDTPARICNIAAMDENHHW